MTRNEYSNSKIYLVRVVSTIVHFFQRFTSTYYIDLYYCWKSKKEDSQVDILPKYSDRYKAIVTGLNISWLFIISMIFIHNYNHVTFIIPVIFRLWEMFIVNLWVFLFLQSARKLNKTSSSENDLRFLLLLVIHFATITFSFAYLNRFIYISDIASFSVSTHSMSSIYWLHYSFSVLLNSPIGDSMPQSNIARICAMTESTFGLLYLVLFITAILNKLRFYWREADEYPAVDPAVPTDGLHRQ